MGRFSSFSFFILFIFLNTADAQNETEEPFFSSFPSGTHCNTQTEAVDIDVGIEAYEEQNGQDHGLQQPNYSPEICMHSTEPPQFTSSVPDNPSEMVNSPGVPETPNYNQEVQGLPENAEYQLKMPEYPAPAPLPSTYPSAMPSYHPDFDKNGQHPPSDTECSPSNTNGHPPPAVPGYSSPSISDYDPTPEVNVPPPGFSRNISPEMATDELAMLEYSAPVAQEPSYPITPVYSRNSKSSQQGHPPIYERDSYPNKGFWIPMEEISPNPFPKTTQNPVPATEESTSPPAFPPVYEMTKYSDVAKPKYSLNISELTENLPSGETGPIPENPQKIQNAIVLKYPSKLPSGMSSGSPLLLLALPSGLLSELPSGSPFGLSFVTPSGTPSGLLSELPSGPPFGLPSESSYRLPSGLPFQLPFELHSKVTSYSRGIPRYYPKEKDSR